MQSISEAEFILCCHKVRFQFAASILIYTLSLHDALLICLHHQVAARQRTGSGRLPDRRDARHRCAPGRSEEHTSELQSRGHLVCRLMLEKKKTYYYIYPALVVLRRYITITPTVSINLSTY